MNVIKSRLSAGCLSVLQTSFRFQQDSSAQLQLDRFWFRACKKQKCKYICIYGKILFFFEDVNTSR